MLIISEKVLLCGPNPVSRHANLQSPPHLLMDECALNPLGRAKDMLNRRGIEKVLV